ncbi:hypothetical protein QRX25_10260 [Bacillus sp. L381]|uniref:hypothetical protein n=1 Tax=Bacillus TaxID=1386 RepID=UPI001BACC1E3|nr:MULTISPECIES: hypothetical protein [Bacillus]MCR9040980.1 hypothetical protein [Bacillus velezensis]MEC3841596.1 hypothetical protein [Bacillus amyloliquefaciens]QUN07938.1 hypothetical protein KEF49_10115 [Bacillus amyloliquefaciens]QYM81004.1 hypothetical protein KTJ85_09965 [Bacillus sp. 7D3]QZY10151.1 hypothetical protein K7B13_10190 [Bacillus amyloliquefaciens]
MTFKTNLFLRINQIKTDIELELISRRSVERLIELQSAAAAIHGIIWPLRYEGGFDFIDKATAELEQLNIMIGEKLKKRVRR